jgi:cytochrome o ubiquinol oxidase subunit 3
MSETHTVSAENPEFYLTEDHHPESSTMLGFWIYLMSD